MKVKITKTTNVKGETIFDVEIPDEEIIHVLRKVIRRLKD